MRIFLLFLLAIPFSFSAQGIISLTGKGGGQIECSGIQNLENQSWMLNFDSKEASNNAMSLSDEINKVHGWLASLAMDNKNNVYFMPIVSSDVYQYNTLSKKIKKFENTNAIRIEPHNEGTFYARMCVAPNGNVYALNNNGSQLIEINPNTNSVNNLGSLTSVGEKSIADKIQGWGGDMVSDVDGNLYVISAHANVFKVNVKQLEAEYIGHITGLPEKYTTNGAAVTDGGNIILANSTGNNLYTFSLLELAANVYKQDQVAIYDLASSNFVKNTKSIEDIPGTENVKLYPTVIRDKKFNVLSNKDVSNSEIKIYDLSGQLLEKFSSNLQGLSPNAYTLKNLPPNVYIVKVIDENGETLLSQKISVIRN